jgi:hypothetical protein
MSVTGIRLVCSSISTRFFSGRGSKNTGWKPSSDCTSVALLLSTDSSSSPAPPFLQLGKVMILLLLCYTHYVMHNVNAP